MSIIKPANPETVRHNHEYLSEWGRQLVEDDACAIMVIGSTNTDRVHVKGLPGFPPERLADILEMCAREIRNRKTINLNPS